MSKHIYDAFIVKSNNYQDINTTHLKIRQFVEDLQIHYISKMIAEMTLNYFQSYRIEYPEKITFLEFLGNYYSFHLNYIDKELLEKIIHINIPAKRTFIKCMFKLFKTMSLYNIGNRFNFDINVYYKVLENNTTVYIIRTKEPLGSELLNKFRTHAIDLGLQNYNYWDHTDKPNDITEEEWSNRALFWNNIPNVNRNMDLDSIMNLINIKPNYSKIDNTTIINYLPNDLEIYSSVFKENMRNKLINEEKQNNPTKSTKYIMRWVRLAEKKTESMIKDSSYLEYYTEYSKDLLQKEDLVQLLFHDIITPFPSVLFDN